MSEKIKEVVKRLRDRAEARRRSGKLLQIDDRMFDLIADEIEEGAKALEADRDNWRRQALDEDARANATCKESLQVENWKETCKMCKDGEIMPYHCEYYGEPNGCNSPTYGEHPTCDKSSQVGNAAAMFNALKQIDRIVWDKRRHTKEEVEAHRLATEALTRPPRNCDIMSLDKARTVWFLNEIMPRLDGKLPLGKEKPFDEWFVSQLEQ